MNIGIVTTWFDRGAAYVSRQYRDVLKNDFQVLIYARGGEKKAKGDPIWDGDYVTWSPDKLFDEPTSFNLTHFRKWLTVNRIGLVIFNEQWWWPPVLLCNELGVKTVAYVDYYTEDTVELFGCYDLIICNTKRHFSVFEWHPKCVFVPWGTDINLFSPKAINNIESDVVTFFHSCGMNPYRKGVDLLLLAFETLARDGLKHQAKLCLHSQVDLMTWFPKLKSLVDHLVERNLLEIIVETIPPPGLYAMGDVYVYPTRLEGIGLTIPEALASGLPVIVPNSPPMSEFVEDFKNGILVGVKHFIARADGYYWPQSIVDIDHLAASMGHFLTHQRRLGEFKRSARLFAERELDWSANAKGLSEMLRKLEKRSSDQASDATSKAIQYTKSRTSVQARWPTLFSIYYKYRMMIRKLL